MELISLTPFLQRICQVSSPHSRRRRFPGFPSKSRRRTSSRPIANPPQVFFPVKREKSSSPLTHFEARMPCFPYFFQLPGVILLFILRLSGHFSHRFLVPVPLEVCLLSVRTRKLASFVFFFPCLGFYVPVPRLSQFSLLKCVTPLLPFCFHFPLERGKIVFLPLSLIFCSVSQHASGRTKPGFSFTLVAL